MNKRMEKEEMILTTAIILITWFWAIVFFIFGLVNIFWKSV